MSVVFLHFSNSIMFSLWLRVAEPIQQTCWSFCDLETINIVLFTYWNEIQTSEWFHIAEDFFLSMSGHSSCTLLWCDFQISFNSKQTFHTYLFVMFISTSKKEQCVQRILLIWLQSQRTKIWMWKDKRSHSEQRSLVKDKELSQDLKISLNGRGKKDLNAFVQLLCM